MSKTFHYISEPYGETFLEDCTWEPYEGENAKYGGEVKGTIVGGYNISRLFNHTLRTEHEVGKVTYIPYVTLEQFNKGTKTRVSCG